MQIILEKKDELKLDNITNKVYEELNEDNWQYILLKPYEKDKNTIISIEINSDNSYYRIFIEKITEEFIVVRIIDNTGQDEGTALFKVEDISEIKINDLECRKRLLLYHNLNNA